MSLDIICDVGELPVFATTYGVITDRPSSDGQLVLTNGFALRELENPLERDIDIHDVHAKLAARLLQESGIMPNPYVNEEGRGNSMGLTTPPHLDGLTGRYYQVHTDEPPISDEAVRSSRLTLRGYQLTAQEHDSVRALYAEESLPGPHQGVWLGTNLRYVLGNREPDAVWEQTADVNDTLVFPNGYDARIGSAASMLYLHEFGTITFDTFAQRLIALSRIVPSVGALRDPRA